MKHFRFIFIFILTSNYILSQIEQDHIVNIYYGLGTAVPIGSLSKQSKKQNDFGKVNLGLSMKAGLEVFIDPQNAISVDLDYGFLFMNNDSLGKIVERDVKKYSPNSMEVGGNDADMIFSHVCLGYSRLYSIKQVTFQGKICAGLARFGYDYTKAYLLTGATSFPTNASAYSAINYGLVDYNYVTIKPEIGIKYIFKEKDYVDWILGFNIGFFHAHPVLNLYSDRSAIPVAKLDENLNVLTFNVSLQLVLTKQLFENLINHPFLGRHSK